MLMFSRVLIANRGEIACRIIRACRSLGLETVAVCSEADARSMHTQQAHESVVIGPAAPRDSYVSVERLLNAARETDAAHDLMAKSLASTEIEGVKSNLSFLRRAVAHSKFASAEVHTRFAEGAPQLVEKEMHG
jgi:acetyl/propionyl-CoA carboxylase alpha subunit